MLISEIQYLYGWTSKHIFVHCFIWLWLLVTLLLSHLVIFNRLYSLFLPIKNQAYHKWGIFSLRQFTSTFTSIHTEIILTSWWSQSVSEITDFMSQLHTIQGWISSRQCYCWKMSSEQSFLGSYTVPAPDHIRVIFT